MNVKMKLEVGAYAPTYADKGCAGADLYLYGEDVAIEPGETKVCRTGVRLEIPEGFTGLIFARSGLATKKGLTPANCVGVIDSSFRGEIMVALRNHSRHRQEVNTGERMAQLVILPALHIDFISVQELSKTQRGEGGFGSTGA